MSDVIPQCYTPYIDFQEERDTGFVINGSVPRNEDH
jgi:hypothetical protein